jgi:hypothetical protein
LNLISKKALGTKKAVVNPEAFLSSSKTLEVRKLLCSISVWHLLLSGLKLLLRFTSLIVRFHYILRVKGTLIKIVMNDYWYKI